MTRGAVGTRRTRSRLMDVGTKAEQSVQEGTEVRTRRENIWGQRAGWTLGPEL